MFKTKRFYFLPFLDNLTAVIVTFLTILALGNFLSGAFFTALATIFFLYVLCGRIYVRMWRLSKKNTRYGYGLTFKNFIKFIMPLIVFDLVLIVFYCLYENGVIPSDKLIVSSYYIFPDNAPRQIVNISIFEYISIGIKIWFTYFIYILKNGFVLLLAPVLSFLSAVLGYKLGNKDMHIMDMLEIIIDKIKDKLKNRGYEI